ncbi:lysosome-associated membrane glycoprotein 5 isoform X2 [Anabrus simplex]|uniref:lysosome-associated membrane glycoprotein 5 isoform X2 n=1 Tax=Anabrus simplex TaxID=316456 RepID=UPI0034DD9730
MEHVRLLPGLLLLFSVCLLVHAQDTTTEAIEDEMPAGTLSAEDQVTDATTNKESNYGTESETSTLEYSTSTAAPPPPNRATSLFRLKANGATTCILMEVDAVVLIRYKTKSGELRELDKFIPDDAETDGVCSEDSSTLTIKWLNFILTWKFLKTPGGERWYVNEVDLEFDTSKDLFENASDPDKVTVSTPRGHSTMLFPTPVGKSFSCQDETSVELHRKGVESATVLLRDFRLQPFMFKDDFGPEYECSPGGMRSFRDETAPIAVGSTLAVVVLLTVTGYGVFRYFKVKKVQYDTME